MKFAAVELKPQTYILVWGSDERLEGVYHGGEQVVLPARNEVSQRGRGLPFRWDAARDRNGNPLPGTVALSDLYGGKAGQQFVTFNAREFCQELIKRHVEKPDESALSLYERGLRLIDKVEDYDEAMEDAMKSWEQSQVRAWENKLSWFSQVDTAAKRDGRQLTISTKDAEAVRRAQENLAAYRKKHGFAQYLPDVNEARKLLGIAEAPAESAPVAPEAVEPVAAAEDPRSLGVRLFDEVSEKGLDKKLTKDQLRGLLKGEPEALEAVNALIQEQSQAVA